MCLTCGSALDAHDRHIRYTLPDPLLAADGWQRVAGTWMSDPNAREAVMIYVPEVGAFVRALLPIHLSGGYKLTYGVWLAVEPAKLREIYQVWNRPEYQDLRIGAYLANAVKPWGLLAAPVTAVVRNPDETPYCDKSTDPTLSAVLHHEWPHDVLPSDH